MPVRLPSVDDLPLRCRPEDAAAVLAALDASGLTPTEFSRRTGIHVQRLRRWRARERPEAVRLIEVVPRASSEPAELVEVLSPGGWRLRVPRALIGEIVRALSEATC